MRREFDDTFCGQGFSAFRQKKYSNAKYFWQPDAITNICMICENDIITSCFKSNKHHCYQCGAVICEQCIYPQQLTGVRRLPRSPKSYNERSYVNVCTACASEYLGLLTQYRKNRSNAPSLARPHSEGIRNSPAQSINIPRTQQRSPTSSIFIVGSPSEADLLRKDSDYSRFTEPLLPTINAGKVGGISSRKDLIEGLSELNIDFLFEAYPEIINELGKEHFKTLPRQSFRNTTIDLRQSDFRLIYKGDTSIYRTFGLVTCAGVIVWKKNGDQYYFYHLACTSFSKSFSDRMRDIFGSLHDIRILVFTPNSGQELLYERGIKRPLEAGGINMQRNVRVFEGFFVDPCFTNGTIGY